TVQRQTDEFSANDLQIAGLTTQLRDKANELGLGEVFGLARQIAGDSATALEQSLINAQFAGENRVRFLRDFSATTSIASVEELTRLWNELLREMIAQGEVGRFQASIVQPNGDPTTAEVVRVGPFIAVAEGQFLA